MESLKTDRKKWDYIFLQEGKQMNKEQNAGIKLKRLIKMNTIKIKNFLMTQGYWMEKLIYKKSSDLF